MKDTLGEVAFLSQLGVRFPYHHQEDSMSARRPKTEADYAAYRRATEHLAKYQPTNTWGAPAQAVDPDPSRRSTAAFSYKGVRSTLYGAGKRMVVADKESKL